MFSSRAIRSWFGQAIKMQSLSNDFRGISISNTTTHSTRVCVAILKVKAFFWVVFINTRSVFKCLSPHNLGPQISIVYVILYQILAERYRQRFPLGSAYVSSYESKPTLNVRSERNKRHTSLSFVEAVDQDPILTTEELLPAYRVAGDAFIGKMKALFLVLDDDEAKKQPWKSSSQKKNQKKKHQASGEGSTDIKRKPMPATQ
jgi:hypothetical protein